MFNNNNFVTYDLIHPELQADQWKIYPTEVTRWTKDFADWHKQGYISHMLKSQFQDQSIIK